MAGQHPGGPCDTEQGPGSVQQGKDAPGEPGKCPGCQLSCCGGMQEGRRQRKQDSARRVQPPSSQEHSGSTTGHQQAYSQQDGPCSIDTQCSCEHLDQRPFSENRWCDDFSLWKPCQPCLETAGKVVCCKPEVPKPDGVGLRSCPPSDGGGQASEERGQNQTPRAHEKRGSEHGREYSVAHLLAVGTEMPFGCSLSPCLFGCVMTP